RCNNNLFFNFFDNIIMLNNHGVSNIMENRTDKMSTQSSRMNSKPIQIFIGQFLNDLFSCLNKMPSCCSRSNSQKKLAVGVTCQLLSNEAVQLLQKNGVNATVWNNKGPSNFHNNLVQIVRSHT